MTTPNPPTPADVRTRQGFLAALGSYGIWGFWPLIFQLYHAMDPYILAAHRILWTLPSAFFAVYIGWRLHGLNWRVMIGQSLQILTKPLLLRLLVSALLIGANWLIYLWSVTHDRILEAALGYYINPLVNVLFGMIFFGERLGFWKWLAIGLAALGVLNQALGLGHVPWVALSLAVTFALYGVMRKKVAIDSSLGLGVETAILAPLAIAYLAFCIVDGIDITSLGAGHPNWLNITLLAATGPITTLALALFGYAAARLPLTSLGLMQFLAPSISFAIGIILGEPFTTGLAITFGCIWAGAGVFAFALWKERQQNQP